MTLNTGICFRNVQITNSILSANAPPYKRTTNIEYSTVKQIYEPCAVNEIVDILIAGHVIREVPREVTATKNIQHPHTNI